MVELTKPFAPDFYSFVSKAVFHLQILIDYQSQKPIHAFSHGKAVLFNEKVVGEKGRIITTPQGEKSVKQSGLDCITVNIEELMAYRQTRFNNV